MPAVAATDKPMTKSRNILPPRRFWTEAELELLRQHYPDRTGDDVAAMLGRPVRSVYKKARELGLSKSAAFLSSDLSGRVQRGKQDPRMRATQFQPGVSSWSKGVKGRVGVKEGCRATQFKKGRPADEAHNYLPIGSLRVTKDGYLERKVTDDPSVYPARRWTALHRLVWEAAHGPVPGGHLVVFKPGRATTDPELVTLDALECITRADNLRRNSVHRYGPEIASIAQLRGAIRRQINRKAKEAVES